MKICVWNWEMGTMSSLMYHRCTKRKKMALETFRYSCTNTCRDPIVCFFCNLKRAKIHKTFLKWHLLFYIGIFDVKKLVFSDIPRAKRMCYWKVPPPSSPKDRDDDSYWNIAQNFNELNWIRNGNKGKFPGRIWNYFWSNFTFECRSNYVNKRAEFYKEIWNPDLCNT